MELPAAAELPAVTELPAATKLPTVTELPAATKLPAAAGDRSARGASSIGCAAQEPHLVFELRDTGFRLSKLLVCTGSLMSQHDPKSS